MKPEIYAQKRPKHRLLSLGLAVAMLLTLFPVGVLAANNSLFVSLDKTYVKVTKTNMPTGFTGTDVRTSWQTDIATVLSVMGNYDFFTNEGEAIDFTDTTNFPGALTITVVSDNIAIATVTPDAGINTNGKFTIVGVELGVTTVTVTVTGNTFTDAGGNSITEYNGLTGTATITVEVVDTMLEDITSKIKLSSGNEALSLAGIKPEPGYKYVYTATDVPASVPTYYLDATKIDVNGDGTNFETATAVGADPIATPTAITTLTYSGATTPDTAMYNGRSYYVQVYKVVNNNDITDSEGNVLNNGLIVGYGEVSKKTQADGFATAAPVDLSIDESKPDATTAPTVSFSGLKKGQSKTSVVQILKVWDSSTTAQADISRTDGALPVQNYTWTASSSNTEQVRVTGSGDQSNRNITVTAVGATPPATPVTVTITISSTFLGVRVSEVVTFKVIVEAASDVKTLGSLLVLNRYSVDATDLTQTATADTWRLDLPYTLVGTPTADSTVGNPISFNDVSDLTANDILAIPTDTKFGAASVSMLQPGVFEIMVTAEDTTTAFYKLFVGLEENPAQTAVDKAAKIIGSSWAATKQLLDDAAAAAAAVVSPDDPNDDGDVQSAQNAIINEVAAGIKAKLLADDRNLADVDVIVTYEYVTSAFVCTVKYKLGSAENGPNTLTLVPSSTTDRALLLSTIERILNYNDVLYSVLNAAGTPPASPPYSNRILVPVTKQSVADKEAYVSGEVNKLLSDGVDIESLTMYDDAKREYVVHLKAGKIVESFILTVHYEVTFKAVKLYYEDGTRFNDSASTSPPPSMPLIGDTLVAWLEMSDGEKITGNTTPNGTIVNGYKTPDYRYNEYNAEITYKWYYEDDPGKEIGNTNTFTVPLAANGRVIMVDVTVGRNSCVTAKTIALTKTIQVAEIQSVEIVDNVTGEAFTHKPYVDQVLEAIPEMPDFPSHGFTLTTGTNINYQWYRDGFPIGSATNETYTILDEDYDAIISVQVTSATLIRPYVTLTDELDEKVVQFDTARIVDAEESSRYTVGTPGEWQTLDVYVYYPAETGTDPTVIPIYDSSDPSGYDPNIQYRWFYTADTAFREALNGSSLTNPIYEIQTADVGKELSVEIIRGSPGYEQSVVLDLNAVATADEPIISRYALVDTADGYPIVAPRAEQELGVEVIMSVKDNGARVEKPIKLYEGKIKDSKIFSRVEYEWYTDDNDKLKNKTRSTYEVEESIIGQILKVDVTPYGGVFDGKLTVFDETDILQIASQAPVRETIVDEIENIDYDLDDVEIKGTATTGSQAIANACVINLTTETLTLPDDLDIRMYSTDGGVRWKKGKPTENLTKLCNKGFELWITESTDPADPAAVIIKFAPVEKRGKMDKLVVNYALGVDPSGDTFGDWVLVVKGEDESVKENIQIAAMVDKKAGTWGQFRGVDGSTDGVPVTAEKKTVYFIRTAPGLSETGTSYIPASKTKKISVAGAQKAPRYKITKTDEIKIKSDTFVVYEDEASATLLAPKLFSKGDIISAANVKEIWYAPAKKPASDKQLFT